MKSQSLQSPRPTGRSAGVALARGVAASARPAGKMPQNAVDVDVLDGKIMGK